MANTEVDITLIFKKCLIWYEHNDMMNIPLDVFAEWESEVIKSVSDTLFINVGNTVIDKITPHIVPALAAICLGSTSIRLADILEYHGAGFNTLKLCNFDNYPAPNQMGNMAFLESHHKPLKGFQVSHEIIQALCLNTNYVEEMIQASPSIRHHIIMSLLRCPIEDVWPVTSIQHYTEERMKGVNTLPSHQYMGMYEHFSYGVGDITTIDDGEIVSMIDRAGILITDASEELDFKNKFFQHLFFDLSSGMNQTALKIIQSLNNLSDMELNERINCKIIYSLATSNHAGDDEGIEIYDNLHRYLDPGKYSRVLSSMVLKINLVVDHPLLGNTSTNGRNYHFYGDSSALKPLYDELMSIKITDFREPHFNALSKIVHQHIPEQDTSIVDLNKLVFHALNALDSYTNMLDLVSPEDTFPKYGFGKRCADNMCKFLSYAFEHMSVDYNQLSTLSSESKALLGLSGFDIKKLPNMKYRDRARVLSEHLGL